MDWRGRDNLGREAIVVLLNSRAFARRGDRGFPDRAHPGKDRSHISSQRQCSQRTREQKRNPKAVLHERGATRNRYQGYLWAKKVRESSLLGQGEHALGKPRDNLRIPSLEATHEFSGTQREWRLSTRRVDVASAELKPRQQRESR